MLGVRKKILRFEAVKKRGGTALVHFFNVLDSSDLLSTVQVIHMPIALERRTFFLAA